MNEPVLSYEEFMAQDVCSNRHGGSLESALAFESAKLSIRDSHRDILRLYDRNGDMSAKEVSQCMGVALNACSGRLSELKALCYLEPTTLRREGSRVLRRTQKEWA